MRRLWRHFLATFRLNLKVVCEESVGRGLEDDFHDYPDDERGLPLHFETLTCRRCGKKFYV